MFSILLSVYCKEHPKYLFQALHSIWYEQVLKPNQIVLVQDGPLTPELDSEITRWQSELGEVLTLVTLPQNVGLAAALNRGLQHCKYDLVARMDTDDIAIPERFKLQVDFMQAHPEVSVSSGFIEEWNSDLSVQLSSRSLPLHHNEIVKFAKIRSPISHPASIFRKSVILDVGGYPEIYPEDHLLWVRVLQAGHKLANIPQVLLRMRTGNDFITRRGYKFLKGEIKSYKIMYRENFLNKRQLISALLLKSFVRLSPKSLKIWLYKKR
ncbi:glycosyltransferase [Aeromonas veronii]|uniref:glycosyltransferase n=1 Tax=Aeromonas veronii TaxID=654 RepID=UPI00226CF50F|nr:glycosyltransferase [Aeromonas veronii]MCX9132805.1 glycosyltransferase [Aeromonas veronii]